MNFAANFWLWLLTEFLWFAAQLGLVEVIFRHTENLGDWTRWQVILLIGTHQLTSQLFQAIFYQNLANLPELVRTGKLDFLLLQPINSQFAVSTKQFGFDNLVNALIGIGFVLFACAKLQIHPSAAQVALYLLAILLGLSIHYALLFILTTLSVWMIRAQGVMFGYYHLMNLARYPDVVYRNAPKAFRYIFSLAIPVLVVANVPTRILAGIQHGPSLYLTALALGIGSLGIFTFSVLFWRFAMKHYTSASS